MTTPHAPAAAPTALLLSGRVVTAGDRLTTAEAQDLIFAQGGEEPLRPMAAGSDAYQVVLPGAVPPDLVLRSLLSPDSSLTVNENRAIALVEQKMAGLSGLEIPVPVGNGRFVIKTADTIDWETQYPLARDWETAWLEKIRLATEEAERHSRGQA